MVQGDFLVLFSIYRVDQEKPSQREIRAKGGPRIYDDRLYFEIF